MSGYDRERVEDIVAGTLRKLTALDEPEDMTAAETAADIAAGFLPGVGTAQAMRDFERARRKGDKLGMALAAASGVPVAGGVVKPVAKIAKSPIDRAVAKVRDIRELGEPSFNIPQPKLKSRFAGYHVTQDLPAVLESGQLTNKGVGAANMQGYAPTHVGGAYFYSDPKLAAAQRERVIENIFGDGTVSTEEYPILKMLLNDQMRLAPDEDVGLNLPWYKSYKEGSFAKLDPTGLERLLKIYSGDPEKTKDIVRDTLKSKGYANGGPVLPADRATGYKQPGAQPDDRLARFGSSFLSSLPGAAKNVATGYVDMLSALNNYLYQLEPEEQIALLKKLPAGLRDMVLRGVESVKQLPERVAAATPESAGQFGAQLTAEMLLDPLRGRGKGVPKAEIIKKPGGNWEAGSIERATKSLYPVGPTNRDEALVLGGTWTQRVDTPEGQKRISENAAMSDWLDKKLKTYIKNDMATERDPVRLGIEQRLARAQEDKAKADLRNAKTREKISAARAQGKNTTAAERQLEQDIVDAEQKYKLDQAAASHMRLHPQTIAANQEPSENLIARRISAGAPPENLATTGLSTFWEKRADITLGLPKNAGDAVDPKFWLEPEDYENFIRNNPWAVKVPPETKIYNIQPDSYRALQLDHLRDELEVALSNRDQLPPELQLTPEDLSKMNMDAAVAHVGKINAWRERNKIAADLLKSRNAATVTFKEYPEAGLEWKELKMPTDQAKDVEKMVRQIEGKYSILPPGERLSWKDPASGRVLFDTPEKAIEAYSTQANRSVLEEALGYEGDVMGHCVGGRGYCDKVISGEGQIFSLRDAKGEPHVTIEVRPSYDPFNALNPARREEFVRIIDDWVARHPEVRQPGRSLDMKEINQALAEAGVEPVNAPRILQIKGKGNLKPKDKYLPFIQDFVRSQAWEGIGDIRNTGMRRPIELSRTDLLNLGLSEKEFADAFVGRSMDYFTDEEISQIAKDFKSSNLKPFAHGGAVKMAAGGGMSYNAAAVDAIVNRVREKFNG